VTTKEERIAALDLAIERGGGIVKFTKAMNVTHQAVYNWRKRGWVPPERALAIESIFGIERSQLMNPDLVRAISSPASDIL
jgi:transposase-like protein